MHDAAVLASALTLARGPLSPGALADALNWDAERTAAALEFITDNPDLTGPLALRRTPNDMYTLTPRLDLITRDQCRALDANADHGALTFTANQLALLFTAVNQPADPFPWATQYRTEHDQLVALGILHHPDPDDPDRLDANPDVRSSLADPGRW